MIDLHSHTTASDGQYAPDEQVALAAKAGITTLAVTDHDTVRGLAACREAADRLGVRLIDGIEVSCALHRREVHVLGHFIDPQHPAITAYAARLIGERRARMELMLARLAALEVSISLEEVEALAGDASLTRPHLARVLVQRRFCSSVKEAFDRFLGDGRPAAVQRFETTVEEAVGLIHAAGGTATIAHPGSSRVHKLELQRMRDAGLDGIEAIHRDHPPSQRELFRRWATELGLCVTAGSDFHGPAVAPTRTFGSVQLDPAALAALERRRPA